MNYRMEPLTVLVDELKRLATTAHDLAHGLLNSGRRHSPVFPQFRICSSSYVLFYYNEMVICIFGLVIFYSGINLVLPVSNNCGMLKICE